MTMVSIVPVPGVGGEFVYCAVSGDRQSQGATAGEALDALAAQLPQDQTTVVVVGVMHPDRFFGPAQQQRLAELMARWRAARDSGKYFPADDLAELQSLVNVELDASAKRAAAIADELGR
jgi:hypothetical protein